MRIVVDAQLPPALARFLESHGIEAIHVDDVGLRHAEDPDIWNFAIRGGFALMTKDEDFYESWQAGRRGAPVIWVRCGNIRNRVLFQRLEPLLPILRSRLEQGETLIEML